MYYVTLNDHPKGKNNFLITNKIQFYKYNYHKLLKSLNIKTIDLDKPTKSQVHTCLNSENEIDKDKNLLISSCDYGLSYNVSKLKEIINKNMM